MIPGEIGIAMTVTARAEVDEETDDDAGQRHTEGLNDFCRDG